MPQICTSALKDIQRTIALADDRRFDRLPFSTTSAQAGPRLTLRAPHWLRAEAQALKLHALGLGLYDGCASQAADKASVRAASVSARLHTTLRSRFRRRSWEQAQPSRSRLRRPAA